MRLSAHGWIAQAICVAATAVTATPALAQNAPPASAPARAAIVTHANGYEGQGGGVQQVIHHHGQYDIAGNYCPPTNYMGGGPAGTALGAQGGQYPQLDASLYPCPRPDIPAEVGGTMITNAAFYPHEMLYAHKYKAMYPPYYYRTTWRYGLRWTNCKTPLGFCVPTLERVKIAYRTKVVGTTVKVQYKSHISPLSLFWPPSGGFDSWNFFH